MEYERNFDKGEDTYNNCLRRHENQVCRRPKNGFYEEHPSPVPPNLLLFEILIEAYMGYKWPSTAGFHHDDPSYPRCAVMGGAVVAALTAWRDPNVLDIVENMNLTEFFALKDEDENEEKKKEKVCCTLCNKIFTKEPGKELACSICNVTPYCSRDCHVKDWASHRKVCGSNKNCKGDNGDGRKSYNEAKKRLTYRLSEYFSFKFSFREGSYYNSPFEYPPDEIQYRQQSVFSQGDVDIFVQASPLTRAVAANLCQPGRLTPNVLASIESFIGGCGFVQEDLRRIVNSILVPKGQEAGELFGHEDDSYCYSDDEDNSFDIGGNTYPEDMYTMVFALTQNALSFTLTCSHEDVDGHVWNPILEQEGKRIGEYSGMFPRNTQLIRLSEKADLVGALMDFDLSIVSCAYDGNGVYVTPRAAYSLVTLSQIVTPFILEEKRNWRRILKVSQSEVDAFLLKSSCLLSNTERVSNLWSPFFSTTREVSSHM